jgi:hypothetical protein
MRAAVTRHDYRRALDAACREWEVLARQRVEIDDRLAQLTETIGTLSRLCGLTPTVAWGLTDACRVVLRTAARPLTPVEVRNKLAAIGFDLTSYANELAAIHTTLKRLNRSGELRFVPRGAGRHAYEWQRPPKVVAVHGLRRHSTD